MCPLLVAQAALLARPDSTRDLRSAPILSIPEPRIPPARKPDPARSHPTLCHQPCLHYVMRPPLVAQAALLARPDSTRDLRSGPILPLAAPRGCGKSTHTSLCPFRGEICMLLSTYTLPFPVGNTNGGSLASMPRKKKEIGLWIHRSPESERSVRISDCMDFALQSPSTSSNPTGPSNPITPVRGVFPSFPYVFVRDVRPRDRKPPVDRARRTARRAALPAPPDRTAAARHPGPAG